MQVVERNTLPVIREPAPRRTLAGRPGPGGRRPGPGIGLRAGRATSSSCSPRPRRGRSTSGCGRGSASTSWPARRWPGYGRRRRTGRRAGGATRWPSRSTPPCGSGSSGPWSRTPRWVCGSSSTPACKALSPAVNDPYTAIQAIEHLTVLFAALAARPIGSLVAHDPAGTVAVAVPARSFTEILATVFGLIRRYGAQRTDSGPGAAAPAVHRGEPPAPPTPTSGRHSQREADLLVSAAEREVVEPADLAVVYAEADTLRHELSARRAGISPRRATDSGELPTTPPGRQGSARRIRPRQSRQQRQQPLLPGETAQPHRSRSAA